LFASHKQVPYSVIRSKEFKAGKTKGEECTKVPSIAVNGRQVNDSYIIVKHLVPVLYDEPFNDEWEQKITFGLQLAMEVESFDNKRDWGALLSTTRFPSCMAYCCCCFLPLPKMAQRIRKNRAKKDGKYGPLRPAVEYCRDLKLAIGTSRFLGGEAPEQLTCHFMARFGPLVLLAALRFQRW
jgi:hypothetical protein